MPDDIIFLPEGSLEKPSDAVDAFSWFTDSKLSGEALWNSDGTDEAINLYHALQYEAEVNNGGHDQYFHNRNNHSPVFRSALNGLEMIGAHPYAELVVAMMSWAEQHPEEAAATWDSARSSTLERLDDRYFSLSSGRPLKLFAHEWLRRSPKLRLIPLEDFNQMVLGFQRQAGGREDTVVQPAAAEIAAARGWAGRLIDGIAKWRI
jgi:hypothetical protein